MKANSRPRSAATTWERVSQVRSGSSLRPVNQAPGQGPSPSSHQQALQTGLQSPIRVTSETMSYRSSGGQATTTDSEYRRLLMPTVFPIRGGQGG